MSARLSVTEKQWLRDRIHAEFEPVTKGLRDRLIPLKEKFTEQLYRTTGLAAAEREILKLVKRVEKLNGQFKQVAGVECVDITIKSRPGVRVQYNSDRWDDTPFAREVKAKVKGTKEARHLNEAEAKCIQMQDQVMVAGFPEQLVDLIEKELPKTTGQFAKLLGNGNGNGHQLGA